ncbi:MAG: HD domain-containing phosphohydrolase [bacterium]
MKIFLAEEKNSIDVTMAILKKRGDEVEFVTDGVSCLEKISVVHPNLLILNAFLPELDGHQLCYLLRGDEKYSNIPIILMEPADKKVFIDASLNIEGRIKKPLKEEELFLLIDELAKKKIGISEKAQIEVEKLEKKLQEKEKEIQEIKSSMERFKISKDALVQVNALLNKQIQEITFSQKIEQALSFSFMDTAQTNDTFFDIMKEAIPIEGNFCIVWDGKEGNLYTKANILLSEGFYDDLYKAVLDVFPSLERENVKVSKGGMFTSAEKAKSYFFLVSILPLNEKTIILGVSSEKPFDAKEKELFEKIAKHAKLGFSHAIFFEELERTFFNTMTSLIETMEGKQKYQAGHSGRVAIYAKSVCETLGLSKDDTDLICDAALLHDIGKMTVPDEILNKQGKLSKEEFAMIQLHPTVGEDILRSFKTFQNMLPIICYHHEKFGGGGYGKLKGEQIPLGARILAVCDAFDAMLSDRPYRKAMSPDAALAELKEGVGSQFDPTIVKAFLKGWLENKIKVAAYV